MTLDIFMKDIMKFRRQLINIDDIFKKTEETEKFIDLLNDIMEFVHDIHGIIEDKLSSTKFRSILKFNDNYEVDKKRLIDLCNMNINILHSISKDISDSIKFMQLFYLTTRNFDPWDNFVSTIMLETLNRYEVSTGDIISAIEDIDTELAQEEDLDLDFLEED